MGVATDLVSTYMQGGMFFSDFFLQLHIIMAEDGLSAVQQEVKSTLIVDQKTS